MVVGFRCLYVLESSRFRSKKTTGAVEPLFAHSLHVVGGSFVFLFATLFALEDENRETQKVNPGSRDVM